MILYLHIGTEKTGSSYMQTILANNRDFLIGRSCYYPTGGKREADMLSGRISPGNAKELTIALLGKDIESLTTLLSKLLNEAEYKGATKLVLSNENLMEALSDSTKLNILLTVCQKLGITDVKILLILRDPIEQALSLFKHRAKGGLILELEKWLHEGYELPSILSKLLYVLPESRVDFMVRKYEKNSKYLTSIFFKDWLGLPFPTSWNDKYVNPSLTLSELNLLSKLKATLPDIVDGYYDSMLQIPPQQKSDDIYIKDYYKKVISNYLYRYNELWNKCNQCLSENESFILPSYYESIDSNNKTLSFTDFQLNVITSYIAGTQTLFFRLSIWIKKSRLHLANWKFRILKRL